MKMIGSEKIKEERKEVLNINLRLKVRAEMELRKMDKDKTEKNETRFKSIQNLKTWCTSTQ